MGTSKDQELLHTVCRLAASYRARISVVHVLEIPTNLPVDVEDAPGAVEGNDILDRAEMIAESACAKVQTVLLQARDAGHAIVEEAIALGVELIIMEVRQRHWLGILALGHTTEYVLKHAPMAVWISRFPDMVSET